MEGCASSYVWCIVCNIHGSRSLFTFFLLITTTPEQTPMAWLRGMTLPLKQWRQEGTTEWGAQTHHLFWNEMMTSSLGPPSPHQTAVAATYPLCKIAIILLVCHSPVRVLVRCRQRQIHYSWVTSPALKRWSCAGLRHRRTHSTGSWPREQLSY